LCSSRAGRQEKPPSPHEKVLDVLARPEQYAEIVRGIRQELGRRHSPEVRLRELIEIIEE
jgi:hypothetical protein